MRLIDADALKEYLGINDTVCNADHSCDYSIRECGYPRYSKIDICSAIDDLPVLSEAIKPLVKSDMFFCGGCVKAISTVYQYCPHCGRKVKWD